jgi:hypothetical protein
VTVGGRAKATRCTRPASTSSSSHEKRVVAQHVAADGAHPPAVGLDRREPVGPEVGVVVGRDGDEIEPPRRATAERLGDRPLALDEVGVGLEQLDLHARPEVRAQRHECLEPGDPAPGDDDPGHGSRLGPPRAGAIRSFPYAGADLWARGAPAAGPARR